MCRMSLAKVPNAGKCRLAEILERRTDLAKKLLRNFYRLVTEDEHSWGKLED
jgi:hypothetical protein